MSKLSHLDEAGAARMVDVSDKAVTAREATAEATIRMSAEAFEAAVSGSGPKGEVLATARIAGIMAAKKTSELIPLCHPLAIAKATIEFEPLAEQATLRILASVKTTGQTGVEMEALTAAAIAALTVYDMIKAVDKAAMIETIRLLTKSGGKSGDYAVPATKSARVSAGFRSAPEAKMGAKMEAKTAAKPQVLMSATAAPKPSADAAREALRGFMAEHRLQATAWAREAGVPAAQIFGFLTGRARAIPQETAEKLAEAARVRVEDLFGGRR